MQIFSQFFISLEFFRVTASFSRRRSLQGEGAFLNKRTCKYSEEMSIFVRFVLKH